MLRRLASFLRHRGGLAAVEFALIMPMMVVLLLGSVEIINLLQSNRRAENLTASLADVVSRDTIVTNAEVTGLWSAVAPLMFPDPGSADIRITSIRIVSATSAQVVWCERQGSTYSNLTANTTVTGLPAAMMQTGTSIIRVESTYRYTPPLGLFFMESNGQVGRDSSVRVLRHTAYRRSRLVDPITRAAS